MRRYNLLIAGSVFLYMLLATLCTGAIFRSGTEQNQLYKVEINRIYHSLSEEESLDKLVLHWKDEEETESYEFIKKISFLLPEETDDQQKNEAFHKESNDLKMLIQPLYREGVLEGYVRFDYTEVSEGAGKVFLYVQAALFCMEVLILGVMLYVKHQLIRPLEQMSHLPEEMAEGHYGEGIKEEKHSVYSKFLRGLGLLKDSLEVERKRNLELEKEKKQLLLSLSHDIKTPLGTIKLYGKALEEGMYSTAKEQQKVAGQIGKRVVEIENYLAQITQSIREDILSIEVRKEEFYLQELVTKVLTVYKEKCQIRKVQFEIEHYENKLLHGDIDRTVEVIENVMENALKYGDGRSIAISFYEEEYCQLIRIFNTGESVSDTEMNHIFDSFFRGNNVGSIQGNGLGLYICREIMRKMDGEIFAEKEEDGMAFVLVIR